MKVVTVVGARPQFIKAAVVSRELQAASSVEEILVHTGQHYDDEMSNLFFRELEIQKPRYNLGVGSASLTTQTAKIMEALEPVLQKEMPDWVVVYGDTNSTLAGALTASQMNISVAHVEAGLRSFNWLMPEEKNRIVADHLATLLFAPTKKAVDNLRKEGISDSSIKLVGDVMYDASLYYAAKSHQESCILEKSGLKSKDYLLATVHRAENTNNRERLREIFHALVKLADSTTVVIPLHPRTKKCLTEHELLDGVNQKLIVLPPLGYLDMLALTKNAAIVATDSGGLQKEAYFLNVPCLTLRNETEWVELIESGVNKLAGSTAQKILFEYENTDLKMQFPHGLYGDGNASAKILRALQTYK
jgi:UDP-GlcNAc3NAcA epimerase